MPYLPLKVRELIGNIEDLVAEVYNEGYKAGYAAGYTQAEKDNLKKASEGYEPRGVEPY